ncbi:hypothetical protein Tco_1014068 [Tanacetum coccineum]
MVFLIGGKVSIRNGLWENSKLLVPLWRTYSLDSMASGSSAYIEDSKRELSAVVSGCRVNVSTIILLDAVMRGLGIILQEHGSKTIVMNFAIAVSFIGVVTKGNEVDPCLTGRD